VEATMTGAPAVRIDEWIDRGRLDRSRVRVFAVLAAGLVLDGFDVQAMGYAAPAFARAWGLPTAALGPVFGAALAGLFAGAILSGIVADRVGRRPVLLGATAVFGLFTLLTAHARGMPELLPIRFAAGLGLGAIMPNATALVGEYAPRRARISTMMIVTNGFMVGAVLGGFLSAWLVPAYGWRAPFYVGGAAPLLLLAPMARWVPESVLLLAARGAPAQRIARWLRLVDPSLPAGVAVAAPAGPRQSDVSPARLFREGRAPATALLWAASFLNVLDAYFVSSWLPSVLRDAGRTTAAAVLVGTSVQVGGMLGTFVLGGLVQRRGFVPVLSACFVLAAAALGAVAEPALPIAGAAAVAFVAGWGIFGGQPGLNALAATLYPTDLRATGIGAALGVGRFGAILGPLLAGAMLARGWSGVGIFRAAALPALGCTLVLLAMRPMLDARQGQGDLQPEVEPPDRGAPTTSAPDP